MAKILDFKTRQEILPAGKVIGMRGDQGVHMWKDRGPVLCPYCKAEVTIPAKLNASFTCRAGEHQHMFTKDKLEVKK